MNGHPIPEPTPLTMPFWNGLEKRQLIIQRCNTCHRYQFYPRNFCIHCESRVLTWEPVSSRGHIYSYTITMRAPGPDVAVPYVVAIVELAEGPRMLSNIVDCDPFQIEVGAAVVADFRRENPNEPMLLVFRPA